jgi:hypothetical protein
MPRPPLAPPRSRRPSEAAAAESVNRQSWRWFLAGVTLGPVGAGALYLLGRLLLGRLQPLWRNLQLL